MTSQIKFEDIGFSGAVFSHISATEQNWNYNPKYLGYVNKPRPDNGLVLISSDLTACFTTNDGFCLEAQKGDVVFVPQGLLYKAEFFGVDETVPIHTYTVNFEVKNGSGQEMLIGGGIRIVAHDRISEFEPSMNQLCLACNDILNNQIRILSKFCAFLDLVLVSNQSADEYYPIRKGVEVLGIEWNKNEKISRYAAICGISESYFHLLFKKWAGMSPVDYRNRLRIAHAKSILQNSSMSVGEVAISVGFEDQFYFSRVFKAVTGSSPQRYRKGK